MTETPVRAQFTSDLTDDVLILSNYYHPEPTGSAPPITDLSLWLAEQGLKPSVLTARPSYPRTAIYEGYAAGEHDREDFQGVTVRRVKSFVPRSRGMIGRLFAETSFALSALMTRKRRYHGVICVCPSVFAVLIAPLFRQRGGRVTALVHDVQSGLATSLKFGASGVLIAGLRRLEAWSLNRCDAVIALSAPMANELRSLGVTGPITVVPPQVNVREIVPVDEPEGAALLVYSGNLGRKQGLDQVLALAAELLKRKSPARILIRGEGSERATLEEEAARSGLTNVRFDNLAPREEISLAMGLATLHLVPQSPEGANFALPSKIFSIMAAERAYVATAHPGTPLDLITRESNGGRCVVPNDPVMFADAVQALLLDEGRREAHGKAGRRYVQRVIDREVVCLNILDTLRRCPDSVHVRTQYVDE